MERVEFRFLQVVVSHMSGDRVTLGLIHWDGVTLRVAHSFAHLGFCAADQREIVRRTVLSKLRRASKQAQAMTKRGGFMFGLQHLVPVREGLGSSVLWAPVQVSRTTNPEAHFKLLRDQVRLDEGPRPEHVPITNKELTHRLLAVGQLLEAQAPDRIRLSNGVRHRQSFTVPMSWKNGKWHHAVPYSLDGLDEAAMAKRTRELVGIVQLCLPLGDVPVPVLVCPDPPQLANIAREQAEILRESLEKRDVHIVATQRTDDGFSLDPLLAEIREAVAH